MKKLVKTAKQQFEERLSNFINPIKEVCHYSTYYLCTDEQGFCVILYSYNEGEANVYKEFSFGKKLDDIYTDEDFLCFIVDYWSEYISSPIKELFEWYASADRENTPFSIDIILQFAKVCNKTIFEDLYEEIPDVRIITAKEQWENDSKDANATIVREDESIRIVSHESGIDFYICGKDGGYRKESMPPFHELRKDSEFIVAYLAFMRKHHLNFINDAVMWVSGYLLSPNEYRILEMRDAYTHCSITHNYEDKELPQEQSIEEMIALTPEQQERVKEFEAALNALKDSGVKIISYYDDNDFYAINGNCDVEFKGSYYFSKEDYDKYEDISMILDNKHHFPFSWDMYWGVDSCFYAKKL